jgi:hypothetical protein
MVDVETMGLNPHTSGLIQLSAIKFNLATREIGEVFDRCPAPLPFRSWNDGTRSFWLEQNRSVYDQIMLRTEDGPKVFFDFVDWVGKDNQNGELRFWAKPLSFDWGFVASHLEQLSLPMPFYYRIARDLNSFAAGVMGNAEHPDLESLVEFNGDQHNALNDCAFQIDCLFHVVNKFTPAEVM